MGNWARSMLYLVLDFGSCGVLGDGGRDIPVVPIITQVTGKRRINLTKEESQNNPRSRKDNSFDPCFFKPTVIQSIMYKLQ